MSAKLTKQRAEELTKLANESLAQFVDHVLDLYEGKAHEVLGYDSWEAFAKERLVVRLAVSGPQRLAITDGWKEKHPKMTDAEMAAALGVSQRTVVRDRQSPMTNVVDNRRSKPPAETEAKGKRVADDLSDETAELQAEGDLLRGVSDPEFVDKLPKRIASLYQGDVRSKQLERLKAMDADTRPVCAELRMLADRVWQWAKELDRRGEVIEGHVVESWEA